MAEANHTLPITTATARRARLRAAIPRRPTKALDHHDVFALLDKVSQAKASLQGTIAVALEIIDASADDAVAATIQRHMEADSEALDAAFGVAWDGLVRKGDAT